MRLALRAAAVALCLGLPVLAAAQTSAPDTGRRMRGEDRLVLWAAIVGSVGSVGVGAWVHWWLLRGGRGGGDAPSAPGDDGPSRRG